MSEAPFCTLDLVSPLVCRYLDFRTIVGLDTAICTRARRRAWLASMQQMRLEGVNSFNCHDANSLGWLKIRGVQVSSLSVKRPGEYDHQQSAFSFDARNMQVANLHDFHLAYGSSCDIRGHVTILLVSIAAACKKLRSIRLGGTSTYFAEKGLVNLFSGCTDLEVVDLSLENYCGDAGYNKKMSAVMSCLLQCNQLRDISITLCNSNVDISRLIALIARCPRLRKLSYDSDTQRIETSSVIACLAEHCPLLEELSLSGVASSEEVRLHQADLSSLLERCPRLVKLRWHNMHGLTDAHFAILGMSTNITSLGFFNYWDFSEPLAAPFAALAASGMQLKELAIELTIIEEERRGDEYDDGEDEYDAPERYRLTDA